MMSNYQFMIIILCMACTSHSQNSETKSTEFEQFLSQSPSKVFDLAIINGHIIDGRKSPVLRGDLLIQGDSIVFLGRIDTSILNIKETIDARNHTITPGFIDTHAHGDPFSNEFKNFLSMGVTTIVLGQDGHSPVHAEPFRHPLQFFDSLAQHDLPLNMAFLGGHGSMRSRVMHSDLKNKDDLITSLENELTSSLQAGCYGMSTGLEYLPGLYADDRELIALAKIVGKYDGVIMSHVRSENDNELFRSLDELCRQGRYCRVHISHLKSVYGQGSHRGQEILQYIARKNDEGINLTADVYPYSASYTGLSIVFPPWAKTRTDFMHAGKTRTAQLRKHLETVVEQRNGPQATLFTSGPFTGRSLAEVADSAGKHYVDILMQLGPHAASAAYFVMDEDLQRQFITDSTIMICTDGSPTMRHPRGYGSYAKILASYVRDWKLLTLKTAVHKMTYLPAQILGLNRRGKIEVGALADLVVFNLSEVNEHATYADPFQLSTGFHYVLVGGKLVKNNDLWTGEKPGRLLTK